MLTASNTVPSDNDNLNQTHDTNVNNNLIPKDNLSEAQTSETQIGEDVSLTDGSGMDTVRDDIPSDGDGNPNDGHDIVTATDGALTNENIIANDGMLVTGNGNISANNITTDAGVFTVDKDIHSVRDGNATSSHNVLKMLSRIASSRTHIISVQNDKPDPTDSEILSYLDDLYHNKPEQFLYRYHEYLMESDIHLFDKWKKQPNIEFYLVQIRNRKCNSYKVVRNRRYCKLQELIAGSYFSDREMQKREPQLYYTMIGRFETEAEREEKKRENLAEDPKFSTFLLEQSDREEYQQMCEQVEEEESDEEDTDKSTKEQRNMDFKNRMIDKFLCGEDQHVAYQDIDYNDKYDDLNIRSADAQDSYFDESDEEEMCCQRDEREFNPPVRRKEEEQEKGSAGCFVNTFS